MKIIAGAWLSVLVCFIAMGAHAQEKKPVTFNYTEKRINPGEVIIIIHASVARGIQLYALQQKGNDVLYSTVAFDSAAQQRLLGKVTETGKTTSVEDTALQQPASFFTDSVAWVQKIRAAVTDSLLLKGHISYLYKKGDVYITAEDKFRIFIEPAQKAFVTAASNNFEQRSLRWIFLTAFAGGLLALLTPCIYSMIPVTVSFFIKRSKTKAAGIRNAVYYALSIIVIFTIIGFLVTLLFGPAALNNLATNWIANVIFFALFVAFGLSFLGAFEITLPSSWTNSSDAKAGTTSFTGIFFMALTLVLVSFSCTGPIIGNLLVLASRGNYFGPLVGMLGFSSAMSLPFALFAFFPGKLNVLGKAGGWLNAVKVVLGFLELALALKFLSNADLAKSWRLLDREVFIALWIIIFTLLGIYLIGKIKLHHDDELPKNDFGVPYLSTKRLVFAILAFSFSLYMVPGLFGAPLKAISAFLPPMGTQDFVMNLKENAANKNNSAFNDAVFPKPSRYYDKMKMYEPEVVTAHGMTVYFDYNEGLAAARALKKPLMIDFTGINCVNCRKMEGQVWSDPAVMEKLKNDFVIVSLYVDAQNVDLQQNEIYFSKALNKKVETLGDKNTDMQVTKFGANSQPYYFFVDGNGKKLLPQGYGYDPGIKKFMDVLETAKEKDKQAL